ncbi:alpha/beta hydrolase [Arthrobacter echini]|uniref:Alpha/beta hydrolase n=1 Tax=Arthrobacter echini TaxID=1529066 RepID=A0A4S5E6A5_9MICC|nr:alpha/beta hydrolase [Arthrobacter echini]THJ67105.1 alpha/beta hydrolase [Arthrobacter echini]
MHEPWSEDILGASFRSLTLPLEPDDEGRRVATLVAYEPDGAPAGQSMRTDPATEAERVRAVLYLHGFSDYFLHAELAQALHERGWAFFALDLHKYGRSLLPGQTPGFVTSLQDYDADLEAALAALERRLRERAGAPVVLDLVLMAHSMGGLTAALWAARNPGRVSALVLNSPWLDMQGSALLRPAAQGILATVSRRRPKARIPLPELGFYFRNISDTRDGEWPIDPAWRPEAGFPIRVGWLRAVLAGHADLAHGVSIDVPILVVCSASSTISATWDEAMRHTDSILDVTPMVHRAAELGNSITIRRLPGALHDVFLSRVEVRREATDAVLRWLEVQVPGEVLQRSPRVRDAGESSGLATGG